MLSMLRMKHLEEKCRHYVDVSVAEYLRLKPVVEMVERHLLGQRF